MDLKKYSNTQILQMLGLRFKDYRLMMNLQPDGSAPAGWPVGPVRRSDSGAARESISDGPRASATKGKEEEQWLGTVIAAG